MSSQDTQVHAGQDRVEEGELPLMALPACTSRAPAGGRRHALRLSAVALVGIGAIGLLAATGLGTSLVYYKTTSELVADPALHGHRVRVGGLVLVGSVHRTPAGVAFTLSDGVVTVLVVNTGTPAGIFSAGQGAIVEGTWDRDGIFRSDTLIVKHSNEYRSKNGRPYVPPTSTGSR